MLDAFLSYARADDKAFTADLYQRLTAAGFRIWFDEHDMPSRGETFLREIQHAIDDSERLIAVVGPAAVASEYVRAEWDYAQLFSKAVVPVLRIGGGLEDVPGELRGDGYELIPAELRHFHCPDFREGRDRSAAFAELERILRQPVTAPGDPHHVPQLPPHFLPRREFLMQIADTLLVDAFHPVTVGEAARQTTQVHGVPGAGKSVIAAAFARGVNIRRSFRDGVVWLSITQNPDLLRQWRRIGRALGDPDVHYTDLDVAEDRLGGVLRDRECLIVMDDVWEARHVTPVWNALGPRCRLLLTTRDKGLGRTFGAASCEADVLSQRAALSLLSQWAEVPLECLPEPARQVAEECGRLPLALAICGAMVKASVPWVDIVDAVANADLSFLGHELPNYPYPHMMRALQASIDFLARSNADAPARYSELAVFVPERRIPESVVLKLWCRDGFSERSARKLLADFDSASLLRVSAGAPRFVELHDLQWDYVRSHIVDATPLHRRLVAAYGPASAWPAVADDKYFFDKIPTHLVRARLRDELLSLVSRPWMQAQFARTLTHRAFASDLDLIIDQLTAERPLDLVAVVRACIIRATLGALSTRIPPVALGVLATCDQVRKAVGFAELVVEPTQRFEAFTRIAAAVHAQGDVGTTRVLLTNALLAALRVESRDEPDAAVIRTLRTWAGTLGWKDLRDVADIVPAGRDRDRLRRLAANLLALEPSSGAAAQEGAVWEAAAARLERGFVDEAFSLIAGADFTPTLPRPWRPFCKAIVALPSALPAIARCDTVRSGALRDDLLHDIAIDLATAGRRDEALAAVRSIASRSRRDVAPYAVAHALEEGGWRVAAAESVNELPPSWKAAGLAMLARSRAGAGALDDARALARNAARECSSVGDVDRAGLIAGYLADVFARTGDRAEAEEQIARGEAYINRCANPLALDSVLKEIAPALARIGRPSNATALVERFRLTSVDTIDVMQPLAAALVETGEFEAATQLVPRVIYHRDKLLLQLMPALVRHGQYNLAIGSLRFLAYDFQRQEMLPHLTKALLEARAYPQLLAALETVEQYYRSKVAGPVALSLVDAGEHQLALDVARLADSAGIETDIVVHMATTAIRSGRAVSLEQVSTVALPDHMKGDVLKAMALAWRETGALETAVAAAMRAEEPDRSGILAGLVSAAVDGGDAVWARSLLPRIERTWDRTKAHAALVEHFLKGDGLDSALEIARAMPLEHDQHRSDALFRILSRALDTGRLDIGRAVPGCFRTPPHKARALADIAQFLTKQGDVEAARGLVQDVLALSLTVPVEEGRDRALGVLAGQLARVRHTEQALAVANGLGDVPRAKVLKEIAIRQAETSPDLALETARALEAFEKFGVRWVEAEALLELAAMCLDRHGADAALEFAERARSKSIAAFVQQDAVLQSMHDLVCRHLAAVYSIFKRTGKSDAVAAIFRGRDEELKHKRDDTLSALAVEEARSGVAAEARGIAGRITDARKRVQALTAVADELSRRNDRAGAAAAASAARASIPSISVAWQRVEALGQNAAALVRAGDPDTWTEDLETAVAGSMDSAGARAISHVALALAETGSHVAARHWLDQLPKDPKEDVKGARALTLITLGAIDEGVAVADSLRRSAGALDPSYDLKTTALLYASKVFVSARDAPRAFECLAACDFDRDRVMGALQPIIDVWLQGPDSRLDTERQAAYWYDLCGVGEKRRQRAALAAVSVALSRIERSDVGAVLLARAFEEARFEGRLAVFDVLRRGVPLLALLDGGRVLPKLSQEILDVEGWWHVAAS